MPSFIVRNLDKHSHMRSIWLRYIVSAISSLNFILPSLFYDGSMLHIKMTPDLKYFLWF